MTTDKLFSLVGAAEKAVEDANNAVDFYQFSKGRICRRDAKQLRDRLNRIEGMANHSEAKLFNMTPAILIAMRDGRAVFSE